MGKSKRGKRRPEPDEVTLKQLNERAQKLLDLMEDDSSEEEISKGTKKSKNKKKTPRKTSFDMKKIHAEVDKMRAQAREISSKMRISLSDIEQEQDRALEEIRQSFQDHLTVTKGNQTKDVKLKVVTNGWTVEPIAKKQKVVTFSEHPEVIEFLAESENMMQKLTEIIESREEFWIDTNEAPKVINTKEEMQLKKTYWECKLCGIPYEKEAVNYCSKCEEKKKV